LFSVKFIHAHGMAWIKLMDTQASLALPACNAAKRVREMLVVAFESDGDDPAGQRSGSSNAALRVGAHAAQQLAGQELLAACLQGATSAARERGA
jgi:hypothetical protein